MDYRINDHEVMRPHLLSLGFKESKSRFVFYKYFNDITIYADYTRIQRRLFAYKGQKLLNPRSVKDIIKIKKIEKNLRLLEVSGHYEEGGFFER